MAEKEAVNTEDRSWGEEMTATNSQHGKLTAQQFLQLIR